MPDLSRDLTIASVFHSKDTYELLALNHRAVSRMNPGVPLRWLASDGTEPDERVAMDRDAFTVVPGFHPGNAPSSVTSRSDFSQFVNSYLHAASMNDLVRRVRTRFMLILDNDFFIVRPHWIREVLAHMERKNLQFFGAPFHPRRFDKYRYFPCQQCLFVDCAAIDPRTLDFRGRHGEDFGALAALREKVVKKALHAIDPKRYRIGRSRDTSYEVFARYGTDPRVRSETVQPVFDPARDFSDASRFTAPSFAATRANRIIERFLPDRLSYIPKQEGYVAGTGFREAGYADVRGNGEDVNGLAWEEYIWRGAPFGFHLQSISKKLRHNVVDGGAVVAEIGRILDQFPLA